MATKTEFQMPGVTQGWGGQYPKTAVSVLAGFNFDLPNQIIYTNYFQQQYDVFLQCSISIPQQLVLAGKQNSSQARFPNPDTILNQQISGVLPQCILAEQGSPLIAENGQYLVIT